MGLAPLYWLHGPRRSHPLFIRMSDAVAKELRNKRARAKKLYPQGFMKIVAAFYVLSSIIHCLTM